MYSSKVFNTSDWMKTYSNGWNDKEFKSLLLKIINDLKGDSNKGISKEISPGPGQESQ
jgi:hypothetical protein